MSTGLPPPEVPNSYMIYEQVAYSDFWRNPSREKLDQLEHAIVSQLLPQKGHSIIDLGCGYGRLADCYLDRFDTAILFDGSYSLLKTAQEKTHGKAVYIWGDINHLPFCEAVFDVALMVRVLHHIPDSNTFIGQVHKLLTSEGELILSYSNKRNILRVIRYLLGLELFSPFSREPLTIEPNFIHHHPDNVAEILVSSGFKVSHYRGAGLIDKLASIPGPFGRMMPPGISLAPALGETRLAPWIFCKGTVEKSNVQNKNVMLVDLLICPACGKRLSSNTQSYNCLQCHIKYPIINGIIDMRITKQD